MNVILCVVFVATGFGCFIDGLSADENINGTVQEVSADDMTISLTQKDGTVKTFDVLKKVKVTVNGEEMTLADVRPGHSIHLTINSELDVVTRMDATGEATPVPEFAVLGELPDPQQSKGSPWLSEDGLRLYFKAVPKGDMQSWVYVAHRKSPNDLFSPPERLIPGNDPTVTGDELEMIILQKDRLFSATRPSSSKPFQRPKHIPELRTSGFLAAPCIASDGLSMFAEQINLEKRTVSIVRMTRPSRNATWSDPARVQFRDWEKARQRFIHVSRDGKFALTTVQDGDSDWGHGLIVVWKADPEKEDFHSPRFVEVFGDPVRGKFARYLAETNELFFARRKEQPAIDEIVVIRGFHPELHTRDLAAK